MLKALAALSVASLAVTIHGSSAVPKAVFKVRPSVPVAGEQVRLVAKRAGCGTCRFRWHVVNRKHKVKRRIGKGLILRRAFTRPGVRIIRLTVIDRKGDKSRRFKRLRVRPAPGAPPGTQRPGSPPGQPPQQPLPAFAQPACAAGASPVTSADALISALRAGQNACVTAAVGNVNIDGIQGAPRHVGSTGAGSLDRIELSGSSDVTFRARIRSMTIRRSNRITVEQSIIGGTSDSRVPDQLIFIPDGADDITIRDSDLGWTTADNSGNTGYGIRVYEHADRLRIERNRLHHIAADGIQLGMSGTDALIDRNEFAYIAPPPSSDEHSDDIQVVGNGPNLRITNNYMHHNGMFTAGGPRTGGSGPYIHAGNGNSIVFENNLVRDELNFMQVGNLGTGGCNRSNLTFRRNTFFSNGLLWRGAPDLHWRLCGGSNNLYERNVVNDNFGNEYGFGNSGTTARDNLHGRAYTIDATGTCTHPACNPAGQEPIGHRKPAGVHW